MILGQKWFSEIEPNLNSAFSLKIKQKLHEEQTNYQKIEIYETESYGNLMVIDGYIMLTSMDNFFYHEMMSHPILFTHPKPENIVIIGGGDCGTLAETLKHDTVKQVLQVEIDERVTRLSEQYFPELCQFNQDPRASFYFGDGIAWMQEAASNSIDVIIIDSTDPVGPAKGLFNEAFYKQCLRVLNKEGLFIQQSGSPLYNAKNIIKPMHHSLRMVGFLDVLTLYFPQSVYPTGWWSATMAAKDGTLSSFREEAIDEKAFKTKYYNLGIHKNCMATPEFLFDILLND